MINGNMTNHGLAGMRGFFIGYGSQGGDATRTVLATLMASREVLGAGLSLAGKHPFSPIRQKSNLLQWMGRLL